MNTIVWDLLGFLFTRGGDTSVTGTLDPFRVIFKENFTGDGSQTQFQLTGAIQNASFDSGSWSSSRVISALGGDVVRTDNLKPTYDSIPNFLGNRVQVVSISASGLVTLNHPPRNSVEVAIYYWYDLATDDTLSGYYREDIVSKMEADNSRIDAKIDAHVNDLNNPHGTSIQNLLSGNLSDLNSIILDANLDDVSGTRDPNSHADTHEIGGGDEIDAENLNLTFAPNNYTPSSNSVQGHLDGIDDALSIAPFKFEEKTFDVTSDSLPVTANNDTTYLLVNFTNFNSDITLTSQLPTNIPAGAKIKVRKIDNSLKRIIFSDGVIEYRFVNKKGEYLSLTWTGTKYVI